MIRVTLHRKRTHWYAVCYDPDRTPKRIWRTLRTSDATIARQRIAAFEREIERDELDPWHSRRIVRELLPFQRAADQYVRFKRDSGIRASTIAALTNTFTRFGTWLGPRSLQAVTPADVTAWLSHYTNQTRTTYRGRLNQLFVWAVGEGHIRRNPIDRVDGNSVTPPLRVPCTVAEVDTLTSALRSSRILTGGPGWPAPLVVLLASTGLRIGEALLLHVEDVTFGARPVIYVHRSKTPKGVRRVPLFPRAVDAARELAGQRERGRLVGVSRSAVTLAMREACAECLPGRGIPPHLLRHTFISWLVNDLSLPVAVAARIVGHDNVSTTMRYIHTSDRDVDAALGRINDPGDNDVSRWLGIDRASVLDRL